MRRMSEDPSLGFSMIEIKGHRVRELSREVVRLQTRAQGQRTAGRG